MFFFIKKVNNKRIKAIIFILLRKTVNIIFKRRKENNDFFRESSKNMRSTIRVAFSIFIQSSHLNYIFIYNTAPYFVSITEKAYIAFYQHLDFTVVTLIAIGGTGFYQKNQVADYNRNLNPSIPICLLEG